MRIDKFLANTKIGSRKEVKTFLKKGRVSVNGEIIKKDKTQIDPLKDIIAFDGEVIHYSQFEYYMLYKPEGYISATKDDSHPVVCELIPSIHELFPVGRLDIDTTGLLIMTNDGELGHLLTAPKKHIPKVYEVLADGIVNEEDQEVFKKGIPLKDFTTQSSDLRIIEVKENKTKCHVTIHEGKFHQVKRMFGYIKKPVLSLKRIQMGDVKLDSSLKKGEYRPLTTDEINSLYGKTML